MKVHGKPFEYEFPEHRYKKWYGKRFPCLHCNATLSIDSEEDIHALSDEICYVFCPFCPHKHRIALWFHQGSFDEYLTWGQ